MGKISYISLFALSFGALVVPNRIHAEISLINTNIMATANETLIEQWALEDDTGTNYFVSGTTITAAPGIDQEFNFWLSEDKKSNGTGAIKLSGSTARNLTVTDSSILGSDGGELLLDPNYIAIPRTFYAFGGNGASLENVNSVVNNTTIAGGDGGTIIARLASTRSSSSGGYGLMLEGTSSLAATNNVISGGDGGFMDNYQFSAPAVGGDGIVIGRNSSVTLNLTNTLVQGGDGGVVVTNFQNKGQAYGGSGLFIEEQSAVTINGGNYVGGKGGTTAGKVQRDGYSLEVNGASVTLADGSFEDGILFTGNSTLALNSSFTNSITPELAEHSTLSITEWYDGQLTNILVSDCTVILNGTAPFNLDGRFSIHDRGSANFESGLSVEDGGVLYAGTSTVTGGNVHTHSNSTIRVDKRGTNMGQLSFSGTMTLDAGTQWLVHETGTTGMEGGSFDLASADGAITNHLQPSDVHYVGTNSYLTVTNVVVVENTVRALYEERELIDLDNDGIDDEFEIYGLETNPQSADSDNDGLSDGDEVYRYHTDPLIPDSDGDGLSDGDEINIWGTDPLNTDSDNDELSDNDEVNAYNTNPLTADSDGDGLTDIDEIHLHGSNPLLIDSDGDGLSDDYEINITETDPSQYDSNGDGYVDGTLFVRENNGTNAIAPYSSWATAATNIQDAVFCASNHTVIVVDDGHYLLESEISIAKQITIRSANGPETTIIDGQGTVRCFNLGDSPSEISGLTITNGYHSFFGGGIYCINNQAVLTNCLITGNSAGRDGGGICQGTANNCIIRDNTASLYGGGARGTILNNCLVTDNEASFGGGLYGGTANSCTLSKNSATVSGGGTSSSTLNNCIVWNNAAPAGVDAYNSTAHNSCSPDLTDGADGNITNTPSFINFEAQDWHLSASSPCIDTGNDTTAVGSKDVEGLIRIIGDSLDMGAYEFRGNVTENDQDADHLPDDWEQEFFSSLNAMADGDGDGDALCNLEEYIAGTDPMNATSCFVVTNCCATEGGFVVEWSPCVAGRVYKILWSDTLSNSTETVLQDNIEYPQNSYTDTEHNTESAGFYRVEVRMQ